MSDRIEGWYWVKAYDDAPWECAYWNGSAWRNASPNHEHYRVGPRIPTPGGPWVTVPVEPTRKMLDEFQLPSGIEPRDAKEIWDVMIDLAPKP